MTPETPLVLPTREGYDRWAEIYDAEENPLIAMEEPLVDRLLGDVAGLHIVDVGCGTGRHALRLAARGGDGCRGRLLGRHALSCEGQGGRGRR